MKTKDQILLSARAMLWVLTCLLGFLCGPARAESESSLEYQVKAAMLLNFAQFVEWPKEAFARDDSPLVIGVAGDASPFGNAMEQAVAGKKVAGRSIVVKYKVTPDTAAGCHLVFVPTLADGITPGILQQIEKKPVLTVGETEAFMKSGGIVRFYAEDNKVRFEMNPDMATRAGVKISARLLRLARIYKQ